MILFIFALAILQIACAGTDFPVPSTTIHRSTTKEIDYRLPFTVSPHRYDLVLEPELEDSAFEGVVDIQVVFIQASKNITLHALNLTLTSLSVVISPTQVHVLDVEIDEERQFWIFHLEEEVPIFSEATIHIEFNGPINDFDRGLYKAMYHDASGAETWLALTQFEPTDARRVFPCFDEPRFKAVFGIKIIRPVDYNSVSNMNVEEIIDINDSKQLDLFEDTLKISTYLIAFVMSKYASHSTLDEQNVNHSVIAKDQAIQNGYSRYALDASKDVLSHMAAFTGIQYSFYMNKISQVGVPDDYFWFGAMENWGCVIYRESLLYYKEGDFTARDKQSVATTIAHEYSHQWFGNLVSPAWWKYLWMNEGFATYFENFIPSEIDPEFRTMEQMVVKAMHRALDVDAKEETRAMSMDVGSADDVRDSFDRIAYDKGGSIVRMMEHILTTETFTYGLNAYLNWNQLNTVTEDHLYEALQQMYDYSSATHLKNYKVADIMKSWTLSEGYPLLTVTRDYSTGFIVFKQERFFMNGTTVPQLWHIPINYARGDEVSFSDTRPEFWLTEQKTTLNLVINSADFIWVNKYQTGYYRVNYDSKNWELIIQYLRSPNFEKIPTINRAQVIDDALYLANAGHLDFDYFLALLVYVGEEVDYIPLYTFFRAVAYLDTLLEETPEYNDFKRFVINLTEKVYGKLGISEIPGEPHTDIINREQVMYWRCYLGDDSCNKAMLEQFQKKSETTPDMQSSVYCGGMRASSDSLAQENFDYLMLRYNQSGTSAGQKERIIRGVACSENVHLIEKIIQMVFLDERNPVESVFKISRQHRLVALTELYTNNRNGLRMVLNAIITRFSELEQRLTTEELTSLLLGVSSRLKQVQDRDLISSFISKQTDSISKTYNSTFKTMLANINENINWLEKHGQSFQRALRKVQPPNSSKITASKVLSMFGRVVKEIVINVSRI